MELQNKRLKNDLSNHRAELEKKDKENKSFIKMKNQEIKEAKENMMKERKKYKEEKYK